MIGAFTFLILVLLLSTLTTSSAKQCSMTFSASDCEELVPVSNPDKGKSWVVGNAGGVNNNDGGGLSGAKCSALNPHCKLCTNGFKSCDVCADDSAIGGYVWENIGGRCGLIMTFDDLYSGPYGNILRVPNGYKGLTLIYPLRLYH